MGSTETSRVPVSWVGAGWAPAKDARPKRKEAVSSSRLLMGFPQSSFDDEFTESEVRLRLVQTDHDDVQIDSPGIAPHALLPLACAICELRVLATGDRA